MANENVGGWWGEWLKKRQAENLARRSGHTKSQGGIANSQSETVPVGKRSGHKDSVVNEREGSTSTSKDPSEEKQSRSTSTSKDPSEKRAKVKRRRRSISTDSEEVIQKSKKVRIKTSSSTESFRDESQDSLPSYLPPDKTLCPAQPESDDSSDVQVQTLTESRLIPPPPPPPKREEPKEVHPPPPPPPSKPMGEPKAEPGEESRKRPQDIVKPTSSEREEEPHCQEKVNKSRRSGEKRKVGEPKTKPKEEKGDKDKRVSDEPQINIGATPVGDRKIDQITRGYQPARGQGARTKEHEDRAKVIDKQVLDEPTTAKDAPPGRGSVRGFMPEVKFDPYSAQNPYSSMFKGSKVGTREHRAGAKVRAKAAPKDAAQTKGEEGAHGQGQVAEGHAPLGAKIFAAMAKRKAAAPPRRHSCVHANKTTEATDNHTCKATRSERKRTSKAFRSKQKRSSQSMHHGQQDPK